MQDLFERLLRSTFLVATAGILLVFWLGYNTTVVTLRNYELVKEIDQLQEEIVVLELEQQNLEFQIGYYKSDAFLELEARDKLGRVSSGERLLVLPDDRYDKLYARADDQVEESITTSNLRAWGDFLFGGL